MVRLQIADLDRSVGYYERVLGLHTLSRLAGRALLGTDGAATPLLELRERTGAAPVPRRGRLGLYHFALLLPTRPALGRFLAHLSAIGERPGMSDHLVSEAIYLSDPDGLGIEVYADRPISAWTFNGTALAMATDPLDVADLLRAGADLAWTGAPVGTRIGHVHFHVDDLDAAASFYHTGVGFDKIVVGFPGALFLSAGGYHHHLGTNTWAAGAPRAEAGDARLLEWTLEVPDAAVVGAAAGSLEAAGYPVSSDADGIVAIDPWGIRVRIRSGPATA
jgi:catechol 2,3-dioxygenase